LYLPHTAARRRWSLHPRPLTNSHLKKYYGVSVNRIAVTILALIPALGCAPPRVAPPLESGQLRGGNVLLVTIDTLRRDRLGAYGSVQGLTPTLDRLAASGVRYARAFSHVPMTLPAHTSILTGRTPRSHGVHVNGSSRLDERVPTLATTFQAAGYRTGAFVGAFVLDARFGLNRGFDDYDDRYPHETDTATFKLADRRAAAVVQAAGDWILQAGAAGGTPRPWFAWVHLFDPHTPYDPPEQYRAGRAPYDGEVAYTDAMLGQLVERLGAAHALERTLIVVTADHGESLGEHGETTHGLFAYESTLAVPLIVSGGGVGRAVVDAPVEHADLFPTIVDLAGLAPPSNIDGQSLVHPPSADRPIYFESLDANLTRGWAPLTGVVSGDWKYIDLPLPELYQLRSDPDERTNLADRESARRDTLRRALQQIAATPQAAAAPAGVDRDAADRLRALGYTAAAAAPARDRYREADDPKRLAAMNEAFNTALEAFNAGRSDAALGGFLAVLRDRPDFITARTSAATVLMTLSRQREAAALLRAAPAPQASSPEILAKLGAALQRTGDLAAAAAAFERSRAAGNQNPEIFNDLGVVYAQLGRVADARTMFRGLLRRDPNASGTWTNLGLAELAAKQPGAAAEAFGRAVAADPSNADAWQGLGAATVGSDVRRAVDAWQHAERLRPRDYDLLFNLGMVLADSARPADALPYLTRFIREAPHDRYAGDIAQVEAAIARARR
jgi:arylsulfatase A-like enzyme/Flp pilus assembly protein TadD